jgi:hypothetical protein
LSVVGGSFDELLTIDSGVCRINIAYYLL